jgi:lipopolysaccharide export system permease protein
MQFLWKYIDEILGKGFTILELLELILYYAITLIPLAVPITILISSVMVFGDMAEKYELSSMKSAGISLLRIMLPSLVVAIFIGLFSLFASNYLKPAANLQFQKRFISLRKQKSALSIEQGIFNDAFGETVIRVNEIEKNGRDIHDVLIYDHTQNDKSLISVMSSKGGEMFTAEEGKYFIMRLDTGIQYQELEKKSKLGSSKSEIPFMRTYFDQWTKTFDMGQFESEEGILNFNRNREDMMNTFQLWRAIDTFQTNYSENYQKINARVDAIFQTDPNPKNDDKEKTDTIQESVLFSADTIQKVDSLSKDTIVNPVLDSIAIKKLPPNLRKALRATLNNDTNHLLTNNIQTTSNKASIYEQKYNSKGSSTATKTYKRLINQKTSIQLDSVQHFYQTLDSVDIRDVVTRAQSDLSRDRDELLSIKNVNQDFQKSTEKYLLRLNQQYSWAFICVVFLFIGAPLGSIIRKGGYGYPLLVAILFYMIFIITTILGEKLIRNDSMGGIQAAWLPCLLLAPFAILLTFMAIRDSRLNPMAIIETMMRWRKPKDIV